MVLKFHQLDLSGRLLDHRKYWTITLTDLQLNLTGDIVVNVCWTIVVVLYDAHHLGHGPFGIEIGKSNVRQK